MTSSIYSVNVALDALSRADKYLSSDLVLSVFTHTRISCSLLSDDASELRYISYFLWFFLLLLLPDLYITPHVIAPVVCSCMYHCVLPRYLMHNAIVRKQFTARSRCPNEHSKVQQPGLTSYPCSINQARIQEVSASETHIQIMH